MDISQTRTQALGQWNGKAGGIALDLLFFVVVGHRITECRAIFHATPLRLVQYVDWVVQRDRLQSRVGGLGLGRRARYDHVEWSAGIEEERRVKIETEQLQV